MTHSRGMAEVSTGVFVWVICPKLISAFAAGEEKEGAVVFGSNIEESGGATQTEEGDSKDCVARLEKLTACKDESTSIGSG